MGSQKGFLRLHCIVNPLNIRLCCNLHNRESLLSDSDEDRDDSFCDSVELDYVAPPAAPPPVPRNMKTSKANRGDGAVLANTNPLAPKKKDKEKKKKKKGGRSSKAFAGKSENEEEKGDKKTRDHIKPSGPVVRYARFLSRMPVFCYCLSTFMMMFFGMIGFILRWDDLPDFAKAAEGFEPRGTQISGEMKAYGR